MLTLAAGETLWRRLRFEVEIGGCNTWHAVDDFCLILELPQRFDVAETRSIDTDWDNNRFQLVDWGRWEVGSG